MMRVLAIGLITLILNHAAWALYFVSLGNQPVENGNWPAGSADLANLPTRYARAMGDPGDSIFAYHGDTAAFQMAVDLLSKLKAPEVRLIVHGGVDTSPMFDQRPAPTGQMQERTIGPNNRPKEDWTFTVFNPEQFDRRQKIVADLIPPRPMPSPSIDLYLTKESHINFVAIQIPANIKLIDERAGVGGSIILGQVLDMPSSKPIADAQIVLEKQNSQTHKWESARQTRSNAEGAFEFKEVSSDSYRLNVSAGDHAARIADYIQILDSTFKQCTVQLSPVAAITGRVIDSEGAAVVGASVRASGSIAADKTEYRQPEDAPLVTTDAQGNFSIVAPQGMTRLFAALEGYHLLYTRAATTAPSDGVTIRMTKTGSIKGVVVDSLGKPVLGDARIQIRGSPDPFGRWGGDLSVMPDGTFEFKSVPPGEYLVSTSGPEIAKDPNAKTIQVKIGETTEITIEQRARVTQTGRGGRRITPIR